MNVDPDGEVARFVAMGVKKFIKTFKVKKGRKTVTKKKTITSYVYVKLDINTIAKKIPNLKRNKHVLSQSDSFHRAGSYLTYKQLRKGRVYSLRGKDGSMYTHLKVTGIVSGREGVFHYIIDRTGVITHQEFRVGTNFYLINTKL